MEILVKTLTRHRSSDDPYFLKDWTAGDVVSVMPDGFYTSNKHHGAKNMGIVLIVDGDAPVDLAGSARFDDKKNMLSRCDLIVDLELLGLTSGKLQDLFNHNLLVDPITVSKSYLDLFIPRAERTALISYDQSGSFDNETVDVGPGGHADANTFAEFESNVAISAGAVIGDCDENFDESVVSIVINGTGAVSEKPITLRCTGAGRHDGTPDTGYRLQASGDALNVADEYVRIEGIEIDTSGGIGINTGNADNTCEFIFGGLLVHNASGVGIGIGASQDSVVIKNTIIWDCVRGVYLTGTNANCLCYNVTAYENGDYNLLRCLFVNCLSWGGSSGDFLGGDGSSDYNMSKDDTAPGGNSIHGDTDGKTPDFVNTATDDYHLQASSDAINAGVGPDTDANVPTSDIDGDTRSGATCDIGADEYVVVGGEIYLVTKTDTLSILFDLNLKNLLKRTPDSLVNLSDIRTIIKAINRLDSLVNLQELFLKKEAHIYEDSVVNLSDDYVSQVAGITVKVLEDSILLFDLLRKKEDKIIVEALVALVDVVTKKEYKINTDVLSVLSDISTRKLSRLSVDEFNLYDAYRKRLSKTSIDEVVALFDTRHINNIKTVGDVLNALTDTLTKVLERVRADDFIISDDYASRVAGVTIKLLQDSLLLSDIITKKLTKIQTEALGISDDYTASIEKVIEVLLYLLSGIKDSLGKSSDIVDPTGKESGIIDSIGKDSDIKGH